MRNSNVDVETLRDQYEDCREAVHYGLAWWITDRPIGHAHLVREGLANWICDAPRPLHCCNDEAAPCEPCRVDSRSRAEYRLAIAKQMVDLPFRPEPTGPLVDCPRCMGLGIRQWDGFDGPCYETCTSCNDGLVDDETARTIEGLMDLAHSQSDPEGWDDAYTWVPTQASEPTLPEVIELEIAGYRRMQTPVGELLAERLEGLLTIVNALDAKDVETYLDRRATMLGSVYPQ
jgi:hypothetical protein